MNRPEAAPGPSGVVVMDKPKGPTSHDVVDAVRRRLRTRRVGHTGTLDPFATGVLPVCVGKATRLARFLSSADKAYHAVVRLGFATTTDDATGEPLGPPSPALPPAEAVREACAAFVGPLRQLPPSYSAKRVGGERLYDLARRGRPVEREPASVFVRALEVREAGGEHLVLDVVCSAGTYVRALARDIGEQLGVGGHLVELRRTRSGGFTLEQAATLADLAAEGERRLLPLSALLGDLPALRLNERGMRDLGHGRDLGGACLAEPLPAVPAPRVRFLDGEGRLVGLGVPRGFGFRSGDLAVEPAFHPDVVLVGD